MKKLLLLALTLGTAASLTACGSSTKEITNFLENHTNLLEESTVSNNYTVAYTTGSKTSTFNVDGNVAYNTSTKDFYELNEDGTAYTWVNEKYAEYTTSSSYTTGNAFLRKASLSKTAFAAVSDNVAAATTNPFASLIAAGDDLTAEKLYKEFDSEKDENGVVTLFYVDSKEVKTAADSSFTVVFTYNLNAKDKETDEFATATVKTGGNTWVYSNLTNEDYENSSATAHSLTTPGETTLESIAALINAGDNMTVGATLKYTENDVEISETVTATIDGNITYLTSSAVGSRYIVSETDGTYSVISLYTSSGSNTVWVSETFATMPADLAALQATMDVQIDGTYFDEECYWTGSSYRFLYTLENMNSTGLFVNVRASQYVNLDTFSATIADFVSYDSSEGYDYNTKFTINQLNNFDTANGEGLAAEVEVLTVVSQNIITVFEMLEGSEAAYNFTATLVKTGSEADDMSYATSYDGYKYHTIGTDTNSTTAGTADDASIEYFYTMNGEVPGYNENSSSNWARWGYSEDDSTKITLVSSSARPNYLDDLNFSSSSGSTNVVNKLTSYSMVNGVLTYTSESYNTTITITDGATLADVVITYTNTGNGTSGQTVVITNFGGVSITLPAIYVAAE